MPTVIAPASQDEVILDWYRAERESRMRAYQQAFSSRTEQEIANGAVRAIRGPLLACGPSGTAFFDQHRTRWLRAEVNLAELRSASAIAYFQNEPTIDDVANRPDFARERATATALKHRPIIVSESETARLVLLEGYHRSSGLIHTNEADPIPVFWGVCPGLQHWVHRRP